jgi:hypothetical protein
MKRIPVLIFLVAWFTGTPAAVPSAGEVRATGQTEWDKTVEAAKKEGKLVAGIPASAE